MEKKVTLVVNGEEISFVVTSQIYRDFLNSAKESNKCTPLIRFLNATVTAETKVVLDKYVEWYFMDIAGKIFEEMRPELEMIGKK